MSELKRATRERIEYPESDGEPMADNTKQFRWIVTIKENLEALFADHEDVFVAGDLLWYPVEEEAETRAAPDAMVAIGRPKGDRGSYRQWEEGGIAPQVVFEIWSPGNTKLQKELKQIFYEQHGVEEYYEYDPDRLVLRGWVRREGRLIEIGRMDGWASPRLGIKFRWPGKGREMEVYHPDGRRFITLTEAEQSLKQTEQNLKQTEQNLKQTEQNLKQTERDLKEVTAQAEDERRRAETERQAKEAAWAKLREMGIDPSTL